MQTRTTDEKSKWIYLVRILKFFFRSAYWVTRLHLTQPYDIIHVHSIPDFEVFAALVPKLLGAKLILDIHDIMPELYVNKFKSGQNSVIFKTLLLGEKMSTSFADHVIIANDIWKETLTSRSVKHYKCTALLNYPDEKMFFRGPFEKKESNFVFLYPGSLNFHQGLDIAIKAFRKVREREQKSELHIYGEGPSKELLIKMVSEYGLENSVYLKDPVPLDEIPEIMGSADVGIVPKRNDNFGGEAFSTKTLEFMSLGVPIIVSKTKIDQYYFNDDVVRFFEPGNVDDLAEAMLDMIQNEDLRRHLSKNALQFVQRFRWADNKHKYLDLVDSLVDRSRNRPAK